MDQDEIITRTALAKSFIESGATKWDAVSDELEKWLAWVLKRNQSGEGSLEYVPMPQPSGDQKQYPQPPFEDSKGHGNCSKCGAANKWSQKKNKAYCGALCWKQE